ncbi:MAG: hypothetical protein QOJ34_1890 [Pseudonocardiales bacterium]|nr:hypothetical protein [Pseudonocardiales bacterium]
MSWGAELVGLCDDSAALAIGETADLKVMDFLVEALVQLVIQFVVEVVFEGLLEGAFRGLARALTTRGGQRVLTVLAGLGFGIAWGWHLADQPGPPKLLLVSVALGAAAIVLVLNSRNSSRSSGPRVAAGFWRRALVPPWRWPAARWVDFALLNVAIAGGVAVGYVVG